MRLANRLSSPMAPLLPSPLVLAGALAARKDVQQPWLLQAERPSGGACTCTRLTAACDGNRAECGSYTFIERDTENVAFNDPALLSHFCSEVRMPPSATLGHTHSRGVCMPVVMRVCVCSTAGRH